MDAVRHRPAASDRSGFEAIVRDPCRARHFDSEVVPREDVEHMVSLAMCAGSTCATQAWRLIAVRDASVLARMRDAVLGRFEQLAQAPGLALLEHKRAAARAQALAFARAPLCIAVVATPMRSPIEELMELSGMAREELNRLCVRPELQSAGAAAQVLTTSAHALGYATCWTCAPIVASRELEELLEVKAPDRLVALVAVGRSGEQPTASRRLPLERTLSFR
ncbi:MAG TPA: nitroreductase family protein [Thermoleophilia bacterium]|nr:nitroreductase family protein [Thermoleophilia bacterium]